MDKGWKMGKNNTLSEFISKAPSRWLMLVLFVLDIITLAGVFVSGFSRLRGNPSLLTAIIAFIACMVASVAFSYSAFRDVATERNKYKDELEKKTPEFRSEEHTSEL